MLFSWQLGYVSLKLTLPVIFSASSKGSSIIFIIYAYDNFYHNSLTPPVSETMVHIFIVIQTSKVTRFDHLITLVSLFLTFLTDLYHKKVMIFIIIFRPHSLSYDRNSHKRK